jgi:hypothetical protein
MCYPGFVELKMQRPSDSGELMACKLPLQGSPDMGD